MNNKVKIYLKEESIHSVWYEYFKILDMNLTITTYSD